jgi:CheY-like chemotaxis protein
LVVDDDAITRQALSNVLKKAIASPDLASSAEVGLSLIETKDYDVIFLDVEMAGMDGFELCSKIQKGLRNRTTPVVFVTAHSDFKARARSIEVGGNDLIAKPFLAFELTVKAITLVIRGRVGHLVVPGAANLPVPVLPLFQETPVAGGLPESDSRVALAEARPRSDATETKLVTQRDISAISRTARRTQDSESDSTEIFPSLFEQGNLRVAAMRAKLEALNHAGVQERADILEELYIEADSMPSQSGCGNTASISRLTVALKNLVKKLIENNEHLNRSAMETAATALAMLAEVCEARQCPSLTVPPVRILIVDDDPIARRTSASALQLQFGKPESVGSGEAAVCLAGGKEFDVIFMDVCMPGIDGFDACARIRQTELNRETPVIFVTSHADETTREQAVQAGGNGFVPKGFLPTELVLITFASAVRKRLQKATDANLVTA